jgi:hypothetical protein
VETFLLLLALKVRTWGRAFCGAFGAHGRLCGGGVTIEEGTRRALLRWGWDSPSWGLERQGSHRPQRHSLIAVPLVQWWSGGGGAPRVTAPSHSPPTIPPRG